MTEQSYKVRFIYILFYYIFLLSLPMTVEDQNCKIV